MKYEQEIKKALRQSKNITPIKTGRMRYRLTKYRGGGIISVDLSHFKYPYYINVKPCRAQGWWERFEDYFYHNLKNILGGK